MMFLIAIFPIIIVSVLMIQYTWPAQKAMPVGYFSAALIAYFWWDMPFKWIISATIGGLIDAIGILLIVFGALLILQLMKTSGGIEGISYSMANVSEDRRVQALLIAFLMGAFFEGAAGFGTPAAIAAPLLVGLGFPPLIAATIALIANSTPVSFGAVGIPIIGGFDPIANILKLPITNLGNEIETFRGFLEAVGSYTGILNGAMSLFIPIVILCIMTKLAEGSFQSGLKAWPLAIFAGIIFGLPMFLIANFVGPEVPSILGALISIIIFMFAIKKGFLIPKESWDFPSKEDWPEEWEGVIRAKSYIKDYDSLRISPIQAWLPYIIIAIILLITRIEIFGIVEALQSIELTWNNILGTSVTEGIEPLYNPGIIPFVLVAIFIPFMHGMKYKETVKCWKDTFFILTPAAIALFSSLAMVYVMIHSNAVVEYNMLEVMAITAAEFSAGQWHIISPFIGSLGAFISGSNTVSNIMLGVFQFETAAASGVEIIPTLGLQTAGAAGGNMICIHNVVAAITTVGLIGKEGMIMRKTLIVAIIYCAMIALLTILLLNTFLSGMF